MAKPVLTTPLVDSQIVEIDRWWRENREKAPDLFEQELANAFLTIATVPSAGKRYAHPDATVRRLILRSTRNHVYYVEYQDHVLVVAVWGGVKGCGPDLRFI